MCFIFTKLILKYLNIRIKYSQYGANKYRDSVGYELAFHFYNRDSDVV